MGGALSNVGNVAGQGAGTLLNVADLLMSARQGRLGNTLLARAAALQDPAAREGIAASPLLSGFMGTYGSRQPVAVDAAPGGPSLPDPEMRFRGNLPPLSRGVQLEQQLKETELPYRQTQMRTLQAQERALNAEAEAQGALRQRYGGDLGIIGPTAQTTTPSPAPTATTLPANDPDAAMQRLLNGAYDSPVAAPPRRLQSQREIVPSFSGGKISLRSERVPRIPTLRVPEGSINPTTQQPFVGGETGPGGEPVLVTKRLPRNPSATEMQAVQTLDFFLDRVATLEKEFTPAERAKYAGIVNYAVNRGQQFGRGIGIPVGDPKFDRFRALVGEMESFAFGEGGKQLTRTELDVVQKYVPLGTEKGGPQEFETKLQNFKERTAALRAQRAKSLAR